MAGEDDPGTEEGRLPDSTGQETVELLERALERLEGIEKRQHELIEGLGDVVSGLAAVAQIDSTISSTLSTFLTDWQAANKPQAGPATTVILAWGEPQPKGTT